MLKFGGRAALVIALVSVVDLVTYDRPVGRSVAPEVYTFRYDDEVHRPLVVVLGGSEGGVPRSSRLAKTFIEAGFDIGLLGYWDFEGGPQSVSELPIEPIADGIRTLRSLAETPEGCTAVLGISKGAELALVLAAFVDPADAYVGVVPTHVVWQSFEVTPIVRSSWTFEGEPLPFLSYPWFSTATVTALRDRSNTRALSDLALRDAARSARAAIPIERSKAPILLQGSAHDQYWPSDLSAAALASRADDREGVEVIVYDEDHYLMSYDAPRDDAAAFLRRALPERCFGLGSQRAIR